MVEDKEDYTRKVYIPMSFLALDDTPITFEGVVNKSLIVNDTETGLGYSEGKVDNHSARHENGGADELDAADLAGAKGTDGQILTSDGAACFWKDFVGGDVPPESKMLFKQNSAPSGWTFVSEDNDRVLLNTSTESEGGNTGGGWTISGLSVNGHVLTEAELPSISGSFQIRRLYLTYDSYLVGSSGKMSINYLGGASTNDTSGADAGGDLCDADVVSMSFGSGNAHNHGVTADGNWRPSYAKVITCQKD